MVIDYQPQIFTVVADSLEQAFPGIKVTGEISDQTPEFPCVQIDEQQNIPTLPDNGPSTQYAIIQYRVRVLTNRKSGRKEQARKIMAHIDTVMESYNLIRKSYAAQSGLYTNSAYRIDATYEAVIDVNGVIYKRR